MKYEIYCYELSSAWTVFGKNCPRYELPLVWTILDINLCELSWPHNKCLVWKKDNSYTSLDKFDVRDIGFNIRIKGRRTEFKNRSNIKQIQFQQKVIIKGQSGTYYAVFPKHFLKRSLIDGGEGTETYQNVDYAKSGYVWKVSTAALRVSRPLRVSLPDGAFLTLRNLCRAHRLLGTTSSETNSPRLNKYYIILQNYIIYPRY